QFRQQAHAKDDLMAATVQQLEFVEEDGAAARWSWRAIKQVLIYAGLVFWAFVSLFPVYWTITTSMKVARNVQQGALIPGVDFQPNWLGWRSLGLSPDTIFATSTVRDEFLARFTNSVVVALSASILA